MSIKRELFSLINQFFDQVFIITLKKSTDRHLLLREMLNGLDYEIFWGVNGAEQNIVELEKTGKLDRSKRIKQNKSPLSKGEIGCALSHLGVYQTILDRNLDNALILEDDIMIDFEQKDLPEMLSRAFSELPADWEIIYLGYADNNNRMNLKAHMRAWLVYPLLSLFNKERFNPGKYRRRFPRNYSSNLQRAGSHYRTHSYGISNSGAGKVLQFQNPLGMAVDNAISEMCTLDAIHAFRVKNRVFYQNRDLKTTIDGRYIEDCKSPHK